ncbi:seipin [Oryzias latipes]|uniref:Seipin n=1 Tax=Oryzias latipes TaxID=8090 RepID=A0A3B3I511_ORYLA|nr:seipin [Oryzias latipes]
MDQESHLPPGDVEEPSVIITSILLKLQDAAAMAISRVRERLAQGLTVLSVVLLLLWIAAFLYGSFYYSYMPTATFSTPVHYYYRMDCQSPSSFLCSYPMANISLMRNKKNVLTFGQVYQITLQLEMPDSPVNQQLGMFMIKTTCFSQDGGQVAASARSAKQMLKASSSRFGMLRYRSDLLKTLGTLLFLPAFLTGAAEQKQMVEVELFSEYKDDPYAPSVTAVIEILSDKVQIYSSHLYIHAHFTGIRYLLFHFPILSALVGVSTNFIFLSLIFLLSYARLLFTDGKTAKQIISDRQLPQMGETPSSQAELQKDFSTGTAENLGPVIKDSTNLSQVEPSLDSSSSTEMQNGVTPSQDKLQDSEAE